MKEGSIMSQTATITLPNRFDYSSHRQFSQDQTTHLENADVNEIVLDFSRVEYLDSSALGMMVMMQKKATTANKQVCIKGARGSTEEILKMANMQKLFKFI